jgi:DNA-binding LacI/PurR family transcriptional regulator
LTTAVFFQDPRRDLSFLKCELAHAPDLVLVMYAMPHIRRYLPEAGFRCIYVDGDEPTAEEGIWIRFSADAAISVFAEHCARTGVRRVVQIRFEGNETPDAASALAAMGIACAWKRIPRWDVLGRYEGIERAAYETFLALPREEFPDVFLFWDDFVAQGALTAFMKRGIAIPDDVKVVVLSNRGLGPVYPEPLTRFECDAAAIGEKVAEFTLAMLAHGRVPSPPVVAPQYVFGTTFPY